VREQRRAVELPVADLHPVHAGPHRRGDQRRERPARRGAVEDEAEDRPAGAAQKEASPSRGLDAEA
jgi:hypothetical protein